MINTIPKLTLFMFVTISTASLGSDLGRICIAPLPTPMEGKPLPWEINNSNGLTDFYVKIDEREPIQTSVSKVVWLEKINSNVNHSITILKGSSSQEKFSFNINSFTFKNKFKKDLCLFVNELYLTWQLYKVEQTGSWCPCWSSETS
jgi:hypothetical protein